MKYIDIHAHLTFKDFDEDREAVLKRMSDAGVAAINVGVDTESSRAVIELANAQQPNTNGTQPALKAVVGLHPLYVATLMTKEAIKDEIAKIAYMATQSSHVVGIGECGLDFFRVSGTSEEIAHEKELQEYAFRLQIELAVSLDKPIMIHCRNAYPEVLAILREYIEMYTKDIAHEKAQNKKLRVNFHFFAGDKKQLEEIIALGFHVSFTGVVTFAKEYEEFVMAVPDDRFMIETDCPYVAPAPHRGKRNEPSFVTAIAHRIAEIKGVDEEKMSARILQNTKDFFIDFS